MNVENTITVGSTNMKENVEGNKDQNVEKSVANSCNEMTKYNYELLDKVASKRIAEYSLKTPDLFCHLMKQCDTESQPKKILPEFSDTIITCGTLKSAPSKSLDSKTPNKSLASKLLSIAGNEINSLSIRDLQEIIASEKSSIEEKLVDMYLMGIIKERRKAIWMRALQKKRKLKFRNAMKQRKKKKLLNAREEEIEVEPADAIEEKREVELTNTLEQEIKVECINTIEDLIHTVVEKQKVEFINIIDDLINTIEEKQKVELINTMEELINTIEEKLKVEPINTIEEEKEVKSMNAIEEGEKMEPIVAIEEENDVEPMNSVEEENEMKSINAVEEKKEVEPINAMEQEKKIEPINVMEEEKEVEPINAVEQEKKIEPINVIEEEKEVEPINAVEQEKKIEPINVMEEEEKSMNTIEEEKEVEPMNAIEQGKKIEPINVMEGEKEMKSRNAIEEEKLEPINVIEEQKKMEPINAVEEENEVKSMNAVEGEKEVEPINAVEEKKEVEPMHSIKKNEEGKSINAVEEEKKMEPINAIEEEREEPMDAIEENEEVESMDSIEESEEVESMDSIEESEEVESMDSIEENEEVESMDTIEENEEVELMNAIEEIEVKLVKSIKKEEKMKAKEAKKQKAKEKSIDEHFITCTYLKKLIKVESLNYLYLQLYPERIFLSIQPIMDADDYINDTVSYRKGENSYAEILTSIDEEAIPSELLRLFPDYYDVLFYKYHVIVKIVKYLRFALHAESVYSTYVLLRPTDKVIPDLFAIYYKKHEDDDIPLKKAGTSQECCSQNASCESEFISKKSDLGPNVAFDRVRYLKSKFYCEISGPLYLDSNKTFNPVSVRWKDQICFKKMSFYSESKPKKKPVIRKSAKKRRLIIKFLTRISQDFSDSQVGMPRINLGKGPTHYVVNLSEELKKKLRFRIMTRGYYMFPIASMDLNLVEIFSFMFKKYNKICKDSLSLQENFMYSKLLVFKKLGRFYIYWTKETENLINMEYIEDFLPTHSQQAHILPIGHKKELDNYISIIIRVKSRKYSTYLKVDREYELEEVGDNNQVSTTKEFFFYVGENNINDRSKKRKPACVMDTDSSSESSNESWYNLLDGDKDEDMAKLDKVIGLPVINILPFDESSSGISFDDKKHGKAPVAQTSRDFNMQDESFKESSAESSEECSAECHLMCTSHNSVNLLFKDHTKYTSPYIDGIESAEFCTQSLSPVRDPETISLIDLTDDLSDSSPISSVKSSQPDVEAEPTPESSAEPVSSAADVTPSVATVLPDQYIPPCKKKAVSPVKHSVSSIPKSAMSKGISRNTESENPRHTGGPVRSNQFTSKKMFIKGETTEIIFTAHKFIVEKSPQVRLKKEKKKEVEFYPKLKSEFVFDATDPDHIQDLDFDFNFKREELESFKEILDVACKTYKPRSIRVGDTEPPGLPDEVVK